VRISSLFVTGLVFATIAAVAIVALAGSRTVAICLAGGAAAAVVIYFVSRRFSSRKASPAAR
jgi:uncharacterized membrane protein (UPF0136 family)